ncbi:MAG: hypothetical protein KDE51_19205 [Anaerolineales bacterium]|nr:hypothetical protein [Anaerolineales bacterium]
MNIEQLNLKWQLISMGIKKKWPAITDEELRQLKTGDQNLASLLIKKYQLSAEEAAQAVEDIAKEYFPPAETLDE